ncbi:MarR family transcriptional regulator [Psychromarinibacter sp. C21-152]|uniref:MarR family transcriptional regulator n=1 Tax=Psychromarinibacter sediminicola TaxID=3033385 RepID=A0AAE3TA71_9RHOB|nr:MarR family transcriptional regulator [Psychromarinibacter sediminicola]MDF0601315.1 MarR family transcriptional regulator [Psychromarinibacter sediminicola]
MLDFDLSQFLPYQLAVVSERVSREFAAIYRARYGISRAEWRVLAHLSQAKAVSVRDISEQAELDKPKVSRAATRLEKAGYVTKKANETDKRLVSLALTDKGVALMEDMAPLARAYEAKVLDRLGTDAPTFLAAVQKLTQDNGA